MHSKQQIKTLHEKLQEMVHVRSFQSYSKGITYDHKAKAGFIADHLNMQI